MSRRSMGFSVHLAYWLAKAWNQSYASQSGNTLEMEDGTTFQFEDGSAAEVE